MFYSCTRNLSPLFHTALRKCIYALTSSCIYVYRSGPISRQTQMSYRLHALALSPSLYPQIVSRIELDRQIVVVKRKKKQKKRIIDYNIFHLSLRANVHKHLQAINRQSIQVWALQQEIGYVNWISVASEDVKSFFPFSPQRLSLTLSCRLNASVVIDVSDDRISASGIRRMCARAIQLLFLIPLRKRIHISRVETHRWE